MKNLKITILALVAVISFSCSSDDDNNGSNNGSDDTYVNFKVNGEQIDIIEPATITTLSTVVLATEDNGESMRSIMLRMPNDATEGTHAITLSDSQNLDTYNASVSMDGDTTVEATTGTLTITNIGTEYMEGTFSFTGEANGTTYTITEGEFRAFKPAND
ncbi:MAG TPA: hypothetical protein VF676_02970 [Flavobacterium sp.]|jgi:hypothetical protein